MKMNGSGMASGTGMGSDMGGAVQTNPSPTAQGEVKCPMCGRPSSAAALNGRSMTVNVDEGGNVEVAPEAEATEQPSSASEPSFNGPDLLRQALSK
jgi:hypothetical protein